MPCYQCKVKLKRCADRVDLSCVGRWFYPSCHLYSLRLKIFVFARATDRWVPLRSTHPTGALALSGMKDSNLNEYSQLLDSGRPRFAGTFFLALASLRHRASSFFSCFQTRPLISLPREESYSMHRVIFPPGKLLVHTSFSCLNIYNLYLARFYSTGFPIVGESVHAGCKSSS